MSEETRAVGYNVTMTLDQMRIERGDDPHITISIDATGANPYEHTFILEDFNYRKMRRIFGREGWSLNEDDMYSVIDQIKDLVRETDGLSVSDDEPAKFKVAKPEPKVKGKPAGDPPAGDPETPAA